MGIRSRQSSKYSLTLSAVFQFHLFFSFKAIYKLKQMGFEEPEIVDALAVCNNNESAAVSVLFVGITSL